MTEHWNLICCLCSHALYANKPRVSFFFHCFLHFWTLSIFIYVEIQPFLCCRSAKGISKSSSVIWICIHLPLQINLYVFWSLRDKRNATKTKMYNRTMNWIICSLLQNIYLYIIYNIRYCRICWIEQGCDNNNDEKNTQLHKLTITSIGHQPRFFFFIFLILWVRFIKSILKFLKYYIFTYFQMYSG